jgi:peptidoglycan-associated lipoprotein
MKKALLPFLILTLICGCAKKIVKPPETIKETAWPAVFSSVPELKPIYFEYDKWDIATDERDTLAKNSQFLKQNAALDIQVEGHCDERGTTEYNLALGERRANAVKEYYVYMGIDASRIEAVSYGEEKPLDPGHTEEAWAKNRRAETLIKMK